MPDIGYLSLWIALLSSIYALIAFVVAINTKNKTAFKAAKGGVAATCFSVVLASLILIYLLVTSDFSVKYVYEYTTTDLAFLYKISAFWAGNGGSLLLWALVLGIYTAMVSFAGKIKDDQPRVSRVSSILLINFIFFLGGAMFLSNPFERMAIIPPEGYGLNPMLQNIGMIVHPVTLYMGYVGLAIPFAFAMTSLMLKKTDDSWIKLTRNWTIMAWLFLSLGNLWGAQWAYVELGWGGFWAWDPVENASFMPWLVVSAFLHSVMIQERKGMFKMWNIILIIIAYWMTLFGTFLVRSGIISSVHAFPNTGLGIWFATFMFGMLAWSLYLLIKNAKVLKPQNEFETTVSKESSFMLANILLLAAAFMVFWGTVFPLTSELFTGVKKTLTTDFFNATAGPIMLSTVALMGVCVLIPWRKSTTASLLKSFTIPGVAALAALAYMVYAGISKPMALIGFTVVAFVVTSTLTEFVRGAYARHKITGENIITATGRMLIRNRRRYGGYIVHLGIFMMTMGVLGQLYKTEKTVTMNAGETINVSGYQVTFNGLQQGKEGLNETVFASLGVVKNGQSIGDLKPRVIYYPNKEDPHSEVEYKSTPREDFYVMLGGYENETNASFQFHINPFIWWLWMGAYVIVAGAMLALWPGKGRSALQPSGN